MKLLSILFIISSFHFNAQAQRLSHEYRPLLDSLKKTDLNQAIALIDRLQYFEDSIHYGLKLEKAKLLLLQGNSIEAYSESYQVFTQSKNKEEISLALLYAAITFIEQKQYGAASMFIERGDIVEKYKTSRNIILAYIYYLTEQKEKAKQYFEYAGINNYHILFGKDLKRLKRERTLILMSSILIPGSGYAFHGEGYKASTAFLLNAFVISTAIRIGSNSFIDGFIFAVPIMMRYYFGTIMKTDKISLYKLEKLKQDKLLSILP